MAKTFKQLVTFDSFDVTNIFGNINYIEVDDSADTLTKDYLNENYSEYNLVISYAAGLGYLQYTKDKWCSFSIQEVE